MYNATCSLLCMEQLQTFTHHLHGSPFLSWLFPFLANTGVRLPALQT